ncbi:VTT domain-containing protein [Candidatus Bipolaricaulota bacterium]|nr:VTT domain-containing protein [Candidatus Bipolaricaulota bacterium]
MGPEDVVLALFLAFLYAVGTAVVLPSPTEAVLAAAKVAPPWAVIAVATLGRMAGSYLVFFLGDRVKRLPRVEVWRRETRWGQWWLAIGERWVNRFGVPALFLLLLIPGFPDTVAMYLLAAVGRRPLAFALAASGASAVRLAFVQAGIWLATRG